MESIQETPAKRRKTKTGYSVGGEAYDSQDDSGDNLFNDYETVATVPLPKSHDPCLIPSSPPVHITQPTQIVDRATPISNNSGRKPSMVQVAASSPARVPSVPSPTAAASKKPVARLASLMAPAGTAFRPPMGIVKAPLLIDLSDDEGPTYRGGSSDDESTQNRRADIKPSTFIQSVQKMTESGTVKKRPIDSSHNGADRFKEITSGSFYKPFENTKQKGQGSSLSGSVYDSRNRDERQTTSRFTATEQRSSDVMANAYGGSSRPKTHARQMGPAKAQKEPELSIDDIPDYQLRSKIKRMLVVFPSFSVVKCKTALLKRNGNFDDAMDLLVSQGDQPKEVDLTLSDNDLPSSQTLTEKKAPAKQQIRAPVQSIQERWTATQALSKTTQHQPPSPIAEPQKPRRRLVQGRRKESPPTTISPKEPTLPPRRATPDSDVNDSGVALEPEDDTELELKVLHFFNTCSVPDLVDIAAISEDIATVLLSQKPFANLKEVRRVSSDFSGANKKKTTKKPVGERIVEKCLDMWTGYEAVDELVKRCEALGKPVAEEMKKWGVNVFGATKDGELDLVNFDQLNKPESEVSTRDSGIGTPTSTSSTDEDVEGEVKRVNSHAGKSKESFTPQPAIMAEGVVLKDYQVVGVNWLSLLFENKLSCILADDMGLGKTCQVIAFLAHLLEKGVKGPHLVVVPGSTLENWLREFSVFCPKLVVMPYYGKFT